ncbi:MAG TPA: hypothetical protein VMY99_01805 [Nevskiaceae bacterium]|nr:hypothetical protein [Nevskiaceae bacterium]
MSKVKKAAKKQASPDQENPANASKGFAVRVKAVARGMTRPKRRLILLLAVVLVAVLSAVQFTGVLKEDANSEASAIVAKVSSHMLIPNEPPTIATIQKVDDLKKENGFYANAKNEDRLLVFTNARLAIIYSEDTDKIINVGPILTATKDTENR